MDKKKIRKTLLKIAMMEEAHMEKVLHMMPEKLMMKMFISVLKAKKDKTEAEKIQAEMISKSYDISDEKYIEPIVDWAKHIYD